MNLPQNVRVMQQANNYVSQATVKELRARPFFEDAIVFAKVGAAISHERKRIAPSPFLIDNNMMAFTPKQKEDLEFIYHLFQRIKLSKYSQIGALPSYNASDILDIRTFYPTSKCERNKIVTILNLVSNRIEKQSEMITNLKKYKRGLLRAVFLEKSEHYLLSDAAILRVGEVCDVLSGKRIPKGETFCPYPTEYRYITVSDMGEKFVCSDALQYITAHTEKQISRYKVKSGDIIISVAGTLGKLNIITSDLEGVNLTENCDRFTNYRGISPEYLYYVLSSDLIQSQIEASKTKNGQPKLALERIRNFTIPVPEQAAQAQLVNVMISIDQHIASQITILDKYCKLRVGLLQQLFI